LRIRDSEYQARTGALAERARDEGLSGVVLFEPAYVLYYVGFAFVPTERPMAFVLTADGEGGMLVPRLEREHAKANALVSHVADYPEYPSVSHPMESLRELLETMGLTDGGLGADQDGYPWILGYRGPSLTELTGRTPQRISGFVEDQLAINSAADIALLR
jgi:Xaa-Pro aminopeptidase